MKAWLLNNSFDLSRETQPLEFADVPTPTPGPTEILIRVRCCGVCHTELDEIEGRVNPPNLPVIPGHQVVGIIEQKGTNASRFNLGDRVGVAWIFSACSECGFCQSGFENLCEEFKATGCHVNGGYAEFMTVPEKFAYPIPADFSDAEAAPLLCAGAIGFRSLRLANVKNGQIIGLTGFGGSGHLVLKMTRSLYPESKILVFARSSEERKFALSLGATWAGDVTDTPPFKAQSIIDTTPAWKTVVQSLLHLERGGRLVINVIRKEPMDKNELLTLDYKDHLWMEKEIKSVANITRYDVEEFIKLAARIPIKPEVQIYPFEKANEALIDLKRKHVKGAKVLEMGR